MAALLHSGSVNRLKTTMLLYLGTSKTETLLNWKFVNERFPWGVFFMVGGGAAVGSASQVCNYKI